MKAFMEVRYTLQSGNMSSPYDGPLYAYMDESIYIFYALETLNFASIKRRE